MNLLYILDLLGTFVFAISGFLTASNKRFDLFGASVIAFVTAVGGGTIRDVLIGFQPVAWMLDLNYLYIILVAILLSALFKKHIIKFKRTMFLFDTIGIGIFTIIGMQKTLGVDLHPIIAILMGTTSAVFGGVIRDILSGEIPLIFRKEVYATACIFGASIFLLADYFIGQANIVILLTVIVIIALRLLAIKYKWALPRFQ